MLEPCARCGARAAEPGSILCAVCEEKGPLSPEESVRWNLRKAEDLGVRAEDDERGFEGIGDFYSDDPYERWIAHQAAKGRL